VQLHAIRAPVVFLEHSHHLVIQEEEEEEEEDEEINKSDICYSKA